MIIAPVATILPQGCQQPPIGDCLEESPDRLEAGAILQRLPGEQALRERDVHDEWPPRRGEVERTAHRAYYTPQGFPVSREKWSKKIVRTQESFVEGLG